jgi:hypothetical protein
LTGDGKVAIGSYHRDVPIHADQPQSRIAAIVVPEIDIVLDTLHGFDELFVWARDPSRSPESRLLAGAKCQIIFERRIAERAPRDRNLDLDDIRCVTAGLDSVTWRDPWHYCSMFDVSMPNLLDPRGPRGGAVRRDVPLKK